MSAWLQQPTVDSYINQHDQHYASDVTSDVRDVTDHGLRSPNYTLSADVTQTAVSSNGSDQVDGGPSFKPNGEPPTEGELPKEVQQDADAGDELDADGFRVEHRYETECVSRSKEVRDVSEDCTELRLRETKEVTLEELKTRDVETRQATFEEIRALLEAQFDGQDEVEIGREVIVEEFTRVESQREEVVAGKVVATTTSVTEEHKTEEIHDSPQHNGKVELAAPESDTVAATILPVVEPDQVTSTAQVIEEREAPAEPVTGEVSQEKPNVDKSTLSSQVSNDSPNKSVSSHKDKTKIGKFSLFGKKKKKMPSESSSFDGKLDFDDSVTDDQNQSSGTVKKNKLQKRFSFGGKANSKTAVVVNGDGKQTPKTSRPTFGFLSLKRNKPKECVKVSAAMFAAQTSPNNDDSDDKVGKQEVYAVEAEGQIVVKSPAATTERTRNTEQAVDEVFTDFPFTSNGNHLVVVAIDFGTTFSGYAFSFVQDRDAQGDDEIGESMPGPVHMMRRSEGGDPGVINQKTPTTLLLTPGGQFHSFGFSARNYYHDLDSTDAQSWLYFEKFKMSLHNNAALNRSTTIAATNGVTVPAVTVFAHALRHFMQQALREISDQSMTSISNDDVRWVITVPAIWSAAAKQLMRQAAYDAGISSPQNPEQLVIALEPEAASIYIRKLRMSQLVPQRATGRRLLPSASETNANHEEPTNGVDLVADGFGPGTKYMVVDCGGGTVDITVHEMDSTSGKLTELYKATGGPHGSTGIDSEFERLLEDIFSTEFVASFKLKRPAGWVDLMIAFESRKRAADPNKDQPLNVSLPFSFIDFYKKQFGNQIESAIKKYADKDVRWSAQGMLRLMPEAMQRLYRSTLDAIKNSITQVLNATGVQGIEYLFLVGGFAESAMLQAEIRKEFGKQAKVVIPQEASLAILKGAVCFGLDPTTVTVRRSRQTYGVGVARRFVRGRHPESKMVLRDGAEWCLDVFDQFVGAGSPVFLGGSVSRPYAPASREQSASVIHVYCSDADQVQFVTDEGVRRCGTLRLDLADLPPPSPAATPSAADSKRPRVIQAKMTFGGTEIKVSAVDVATGRSVRCNVDFLSQ